MSRPLGSRKFSPCRAALSIHRFSPYFNPNANHRIPSSFPIQVIELPSQKHSSLFVEHDQKNLAIARPPAIPTSHAVLFGAPYPLLYPHFHRPAFTGDPQTVQRSPKTFWQKPIFHRLSTRDIPEGREGDRFPRTPAVAQDTTHVGLFRSGNMIRCYMYFDKLYTAWDVANVKIFDLVRKAKHPIPS